MPNVTLPRTIVTVTGDVTHTGDTAFTDVTGAEIPSSAFTTGNKYLIVITAQQAIDDGTDEYYSGQVIHGSTAFADSLMTNEQNDSTGSKYWPFVWFDYWTAVASEGIKLQHQLLKSTNTVTTRQVVMIAFDLTAAGLVLNTDYFADSDATATDLNTTWGKASDAAVSVSPTENLDALVFTLSQANVVDPSDRTEATRINVSGDLTDTDETWQALEKNPVCEALRVNIGIYSLTSGGSYTFTQETRQTAGNPGDHIRNASKIFVLLLNKLPHTFARTVAEQTALTTLTTLESFSHSASSGDVWVLGKFSCDDPPNVEHRLRVGGTDTPTGQSTIKDWLWGATSTDETLVINQDIVNGLGGSITVSLHGAYDDSTAKMEDTLLFAIDLDAAGAAGGGAAGSNRNHLLTHGIRRRSGGFMASRL